MKRSSVLMVVFVALLPFLLQAGECEKWNGSIESTVCGWQSTGILVDADQNIEIIPDPDGLLLIQWEQQSAIGGYRVSSTSCSWQDTGINFSVEDKVIIEASGEVIYGRNPQGIGPSKCGPDGSGQQVCADPDDDCCLAPGLPSHSLVGKIGLTGVPFLVGTHLELDAEVDGTLYLAMNEEVNCGGCADNEGSWSVTICTYQKSNFGPEGIPGTCDDLTNVCCLAPGLPSKALVGRIGSGEPFLIGSGFTEMAQESGILYLGINDPFNCGDECPDCPPNEGAWTVNVSVCDVAPCWIMDCEEGPIGWIPTGLWHYVDCAWWFADSASGTYGASASSMSLDDARVARSGSATSVTVKSGAGVYGDLTSPDISVRGDATATLTFNYRREVEFHTAASYDKTYVQVSYDQGLWETVWSRDSKEPSNFEPEQATVELAVPAGVTALRIRFVFDSVDDFLNNYRGWKVYAVSVCQGARVATPTFVPSPDDFDCSVDNTVNIRCSTRGAAIRYTVDGSIPTEDSRLYTGPISITKTTTIKAQAFKSGMQDSEVAEAMYTCGGSDPAECWSDDDTEEVEWSATGLWHPVSQADPQEMVWRFSDPQSDTYDVPGEISQGTLTSPAIDVSGWTAVVLEFFYRLEVEPHAPGGFDETYVEVQFDNGSWHEVWFMDCSVPSTDVLSEVSVSLASYMPVAGASELRIRFVFDSVDRFFNKFDGWILEDVLVCPESIVVSSSELGTLAAEDLLEVQLTAICRPNPVSDVNTTTFSVQGASPEEMHVQIYDVTGKLVYEDRIAGGELDWHTEGLDGDYLANGVYLFRIWALIEGQWRIVGNLEKVVILR